MLIVRTDGQQQWLAGNGPVDIDVPDAADFKLTSYAPAPDWARDGVVYQIFPDRFARSAAAADRPTPLWAIAASWSDTVIFEGADPRTPLQFFGGDLDGITEHLDHVERVGADIVYTTPVFPGESNHRYNATTFDTVDPLLGGDVANMTGRLGSTRRGARGRARRTRHGRVVARGPGRHRRAQPRRVRRRRRRWLARHDELLRLLVAGVVVVAF